jgi:membrane-associated phospholipid phosphatase
MGFTQNFLELDLRLSNSRMTPNGLVGRALGRDPAHLAILDLAGPGIAYLSRLPGRYAWPRSCVITTAVLVLLVKFSVRRQRPAGEWGQIYRSSDPHSFPSGHAARAAMLAVLAAGLGPAWLAGLLLVWAPLVGLARVAMGVHYLSDVVAGMLALIGLIIQQLHPKVFPQLTKIG